MTEEERSWKERRRDRLGEQVCFSISEKDLAEIVAGLRADEEQ